MNKGFTFVEIMVVAALIMVLIVMTTIYFTGQNLRVKTFAAEYYLINLSKAMETYYINHNSYPTDLNFLTTANPKYINLAICTTEESVGEFKGYQYTCEEINEYSYRINARPHLNQGNACWQLTVGGILSRKNYNKNTGACEGEWQTP